MPRKRKQKERVVEERKKKSSSSDNSGSSGRKRKAVQRSPSPERLPSPQRLTLIEGKLQPNAYLLVDHLTKVIKLKNHDDFERTFEKVRGGKLGKGIFGKVKTYRKIGDKYETEYAVKVVNKRKAWKEVSSPWLKLSLYCEAAVFTEILPRHENIINVYSILESPKYIYYVMERLESFNLNQLVPSFSPESSRRCFHKILNALHHLHSHGVVHNDLSLENICVRDGDIDNPILVDFGCCFYLPEMVRVSREHLDIHRIFTQQELVSMRTRTSYEDTRELAGILKVFLTGNIGIGVSTNISEVTKVLKDGTHSLALSFLEVLETPDKLRSLSIMQLMEHPWFKVEPNLVRRLHR